MMREKLAVAILLGAGLGAGKVTTAAADQPAPKQQGEIVVAAHSSRAVIEGPLTLRAYSANKGLSIFLARATGRGDADCSAGGNAGARRELRRDRVAVVQVPAGTVACASSSEDHEVDLLWRARQEDRGTILAIAP